MIPHIEFQEKAVRNGVPETTLLKDYALSWLLKAINDLTNFFVLKGGTGIRKTYIRGYRFSLDLDFTVEQKIRVDHLLEQVVEIAKNESGIDFEDSIDLNPVKSGFSAKIPFRLYYPTLMKIKLDITLPDREITVLPTEKRWLLHLFSDECHSKVSVYSLKEIFSEKIRTLFERTRARDLYDVWYLSKRINIQEIVTIVDKKFKYKKIKPVIEDFIERTKDYKYSWNASLKTILKEIPEFDDVKNYLLPILNKIL